MRNTDGNNLTNPLQERITQPLPFSDRKTENTFSNYFYFNNEDIIPKEKLRYIYGDTYISVQNKMINIEMESINYFSSLIKELNEKYNEFNKNLNDNFVSETKKITEAFNLNSKTDDNQNQISSNIQKYTQKYIEKINNLINVHEQIFANIKESMSIFFKCLNIPKNLNNEKPIIDFINSEFNNILQNWLFLKINLEKIDIMKKLKENGVDYDLQNYIFKIFKNKNFVMNVYLPENNMITSNRIFEKLDKETQNDINSQIQNTKKLMADNNSNLIKVEMNNIFYADNYFDKKIKYERIKYMKFNNVTFSQKKNKFLQNIPNLEKLTINGSNNFEIALLENMSKSLIKLSLNKNNFVDYEFNNIMYNYLDKSESIRVNLQVLSFSNNNLTNIELEPRHKFHSLKELNFEKNKIYKFNIATEYFGELKIINCCSNCFSKSYFDRYNNILTLLSGNIYLTDIKMAENYFFNLQKKINSSTIPINYLNISFIPKILSYDYLSNMIINESIIIKLKKLDLSHNNIKCDTLFNYLENNKGCLSLKLLNLSYNLLDDSFFEKYLNLKLNTFFTNLKYIYLDSNKFGEDIGTQQETSESIIKNNKEKDICRSKILYKFIVENKKLVELTITKNPMKKQYIASYKKKDIFNIKKYIQFEENGHIIVNSFYSLLYKIRKELFRNHNENRTSFNLMFDLENMININSEKFDYKNKYINYIENK